MVKIKKCDIGWFNDTCSFLVYPGRLLVFISKFSNLIGEQIVPTPQDNIIEKLERVIEHQRKEIFELKEETLMLRIQLKAMGVDVKK